MANESILTSGGSDPSFWNNVINSALQGAADVGLQQIDNLGTKHAAAQQAPSPASSTVDTKTLFLIGGALVAVLALFLMLRK
jgi:hypothetical protein